MFKKIIAGFMVNSAMKGQPQGYITLLYSPNYELSISELQSISKTPTWIYSVKDGEYSMRSNWDRSGNVLKAIALQAEDKEARQRASKLLSFYRVQGPPLWRWKMTFLPIDMP